MTPLRILHSEAAVSFGGQEHRIYKEMLAMRERGHHLELVCQPQALLVERMRDQGFVVHTTPMRGPANFVKGVAKISSILRRGRFDVLNTHSRRDTLLAGTAARLARTPLIVRTRHLAKPAGSLLSYTWIPHRVTTVSDRVRLDLIERGVPADRIATVYTSVQAPAAVDASPLRQELRLALNDVVVGCVAVMRAKKGHRALIDAIMPLIKERPNVHLVLIGAGSPVFEQLQEYIEANALTKRVHLMGTRRDVPMLLPGMDIFALATEEEALGTSFLEAAAAGLPVIGTDVGGVCETMENGVTGLLVPLHDQAALAAALKRLIDDADLRVSMGQAGKRLFLDGGKFSTEQLVASTENCYTRWLKERQA
jgi:glycosyltransferase involved in cell wall biosynthesis